MFFTLLIVFFGAATALAQEGLVFPVEPEEVIFTNTGDRVEVYRGTVDQVYGTRLTIRFPHGERYTYDVPAGYRFEVGGRKLSVANLQRGQELTAYVTKQMDSGHALYELDEPEPESYVARSVLRPVQADARRGDSASSMPSRLPATADNTLVLPLAGLAVLLAGVAGLIGAGRRGRRGA
jgi:LPXTG-motif cell wall-anchored protein